MMRAIRYTLKTSIMRDPSDILGRRRTYTIERALEPVARVSEAAGKASEPVAKTRLSKQGEQGGENEQEEDTIYRFT